MGIQHYMPENEPILISILYDSLDIVDVKELFTYVDQMITKRNLSYLYWIGDSKAVDASRETILKAIESTIIGKKGTGGDIRIIPLLVMDEDLHQFFIGEFRNRYDWANFPAFTNVYEAYTFVQFIQCLQNE